MSPSLIRLNACQRSSAGEKGATEACWIPIEMEGKEATGGEKTGIQGRQERVGKIERGSRHKAQGRTRKQV